MKRFEIMNDKRETLKRIDAGIKSVRELLQNPHADFVMKKQLQIKLKRFNDMIIEINQSNEKKFLVIKRIVNKI